MTRPPLIAVTVDLTHVASLALWRDLFLGLTSVSAAAVAVDCGTAEVDMDSVLRAVDGVILSGGGDIDPAIYGGDSADPVLACVNSYRDRNELQALAAARAQGKPVLGICRGAQLTNVALGGTLYPDLDRDRPGSLKHRYSEQELRQVHHQVHLESGKSRLSTWLDGACEIAVNSLHHQGVCDLAPGVTVTATAPDGLVEAFETPGELITCVQWHPETLWAHQEHARALLAGFVESCA
ncbi:gamma-glutamyl-gamma-aminobutyrate hydrolase family protein [Pseudonocardia hispaniensis]|uniref:Gamma-glutamyl-gamma-aminobutyrate hydrolase family protein n=1 Tax=Pseudonocardia hispaniensis TaxID=904933 RepID=A0ABW1J3H2_9PSEU